jgi:DNA-binding response OmpR family regulator
MLSAKRESRRHPAGASTSSPRSEIKRSSGIAEIVLVQDEDPPFRLAAWVLREEGFTVTVVRRTDTLSVTAPATAPDIAIANLEGPADGHAATLGVLRDAAHGAPILHITDDAAHEKAACPCDAVISPPFTADTLLGEIARLTHQT